VGHSSIVLMNSTWLLILPSKGCLPTSMGFSPICIFSFLKIWPGWEFSESLSSVSFWLKVPSLNHFSLFSSYYKHSRESKQLLQHLDVSSVKYPIS
jgi:hypothetical protein